MIFTRFDLQSHDHTTHPTDPYYFPDKFLVSQHNTAIMQKTRYPFNSDRAIITTTREFIARSSRLYRAFTFPVRAWLKPIWQCKITGTPGLKHCQFRTIQMAAAPIRRNVRARAPDFVNVRGIPSNKEDTSTTASFHREKSTHVE